MLQFCPIIHPDRNHFHNRTGTSTTDWVLSQLKVSGGPLASKAFGLRDYHGSVLGFRSSFCSSRATLFSSGAALFSSGAGLSIEEIMKNVWKSLHFQRFWVPHASHFTEEIMRNAENHLFSMVLRLPRFPLHRTNREILWKSRNFP